MHIENFLPLKKVISQWSDRKKEIELPVFSGYLFVKTIKDRFSDIKKTRGVVRIVGFDNVPVPIPEEEINSLKILIEGKKKFDIYPYFKEGKEVIIKRGILKGAIGRIEAKKGKYRFIVSIHLIKRSVAVEIDAQDIELA